MEAKPETIKVAAQGNPNRPSEPTDASLLATCFDYYEVYYTNGVETGRAFLYQVCGGGSDGSGSGSGSGDGNGSTEGGGNSTSSTSGISPNTVLVVAPDIPVNNIRQYLKCFTASQGATFTIYAQQLRPGRPDTWAGLPPRVGHSFMSITQNGITRVFGFYPTSPFALVDDGPGIIGDDSHHIYSVSITTTLSLAKLNNLLTYIYSNSSNTYVLPNYNCTD